MYYDELKVLYDNIDNQYSSYCQSVTTFPVPQPVYMRSQILINPISFTSKHWCASMTTSG